MFDLKEHLSTPVPSSNFGLKEFWHLSEVGSFICCRCFKGRVHTA